MPSHLRYRSETRRQVLPVDARDTKEIHRSHVLEFINSDGFGVVRMLGANANSNAVASPPSISQPPAIVLPQDYEDPSWESSYRNPWQSQAKEGTLSARIPGPIAFLRMHQDSIVDYSYRQGFGYVKNREQVAGFEAHHFRTVPKLERQAGGERWLLSRLDLVSCSARRARRLRFRELAAHGGTEKSPCPSP